MNHGHQGTEIFSASNQTYREKRTQWYLIGLVSGIGVFLIANAIFWCGFISGADYQTDYIIHVERAARQYKSEEESKSNLQKTSQN